MKVLVVAGVPFELGAMPRRAWEGVTFGVAGPGRGRAIRLSSLLKAERPDAVLGVGFCGALLEGIPPLQVAVPEAVGDGRLWLPLDPEALGLGRLKDGLLVSVPHVVATREEKAELGRRTGAIFVDMESFWWCRAAQREGVPFAVLRVVLDGANDPLPVWRRPATLVRLPSLARSAYAARRRLQDLVLSVLHALAAEPRAGGGRPRRAREGADLN